MKRSQLSLAAAVANGLALGATAPGLVSAEPDRGESVFGWAPKPAPRYSATPNSAHGKHTAKDRAKAKAAKYARKAQRLRAKGKR